jgi:SulP family sulfate permease
MTNVTEVIYRTLDPDICRGCSRRVFRECGSNLLPDGLRRQRLMLATDGSEFSHAPQEIAIALAKSFGVTLDVMTWVPAAEDDEVARARLAVASRSARAAGVGTEEIVRHGRAAVPEVIGAAAAADANILIVGRRPARGDLKERLLGDVVAQIIAGAHCHVLIAGWQSKMWSQRILVASDGSSEGDHVADIAMQLATATRTPVTLVTTAASARERQSAEEDLAHKAARMRIAAIECDTRVAAGAAERALAGVAQEIAADLVVIGHHQGLGGRATERIITELGCPVLVVRPGALAKNVDKALAKQA